MIQMVARESIQLTPLLEKLKMTLDADRLEPQYMYMTGMLR